MKCSHCLYEWESRVDNPKCCPACHTRLHKKRKENAECYKCGYGWKPNKKLSEIKMCPRCKSRNWNDVLTISGEGVLVNGKI